MGRDLFRLDGKTALVTGCRRGIGRALTVALAEAGADIVGVSAHLEPTGSETERAVRAAGRGFHSFACDLSDRKALLELVRRLRVEAPPIDILVNNAGTIHRAAAAEHADSGWDHVMRVNLDAPFLLAREIGGDMIARGHGKIIFIASLMTFQGGIHIPGYAASKGAIGQLTMALSNEWAGRGVCVNAIAPGYIATDLTAGLREDEIRNRQILERIPAGRWGRPEDLKGAVVFLASPASDYVSGHILVVDGGWMGR